MWLISMAHDSSSGQWIFVMMRLYDKCFNAIDRLVREHNFVKTEWGNLNIVATKWIHKGTISGPQFQKFTFFGAPDFFFFLGIFRENFTVHNKLPIQQFSWKQPIFGNRDNSSLMGQFKPVFLVNHLNIDFLKFKCIFYFSW